MAKSFQMKNLCVRRVLWRGGSKFSVVVVVLSRVSPLWLYLPCLLVGAFDGVLVSDSISSCFVFLVVFALSLQLWRKGEKETAPENEMRKFMHAYRIEWEVK